MNGRARDTPRRCPVPHTVDIGYPEHSAHHSHPWLRHSLMRFTASILGLELDITFGPATETAAEDDPSGALNGGTLASTPMTFFPSPATPMEWQPPERTIPWGPEDREAT